MSSAANSIITALARGFGQPPKIASLTELQKADADLADVKSQTAQRNAIAQRQTAEAEAIKKKAERDAKDQAIEDRAHLDSGGDYDKFLKNVQAGGISAPAHYGLVKLGHELATAAATRSSTELKQRIDQHNRLTDLFDSVKRAPAEQKQQQWEENMRLAVQEGLMDPAHVEVDYPGDERVSVLSNVTKSQKQFDEQAEAAQKLADEKAKADREKATEAQNALLRPLQLREQTAKADTEEQTLSDKTRQSDATMLAAAAQKGPEALQAIIDELPLKRAKPFLSAKTPQDFLRLGMTPEQITTADANATKPQPLDEAKLAYAVTQGQQPNATPEQKQAGAIADATLKRMTADKVAARPTTNVYTPAAPPVDANGQPRQSTIDDVPAGLRSQIQSVLDYGIKLPPSSARNPTNTVIREWVTRIDPNYSESKFAERNKIVVDFGASGKSGQAITSTDTALAHIGTISEAGRALKSNNIQVLNRLANFVGTQVGKSPQATYEAIVDTVAPEISKAVIGAAGGQEEREKMKANFAAKLSDAQREGAIGGVAQLLGARFHKMQQAYESDMERPLSRKLSPESQAVLDRYSGGGDGGTVAYKVGATTYNIPKGEETEFLKDHPKAEKQ